MTQALSPIGRGHGHAKLILVGEHWVLDGAVAVAIALPSLHTTAQFTDHACGCAAVTYHWPATLAGPATALAMQMANLACEQAGIAPAAIAVESTIPIQRRMGSSAALAVALVRAAADFSQQTLDDATLLQRARTLEDCVHGQSSGLDPAAASAAGGAVLFANGQIVERLPTVAPSLSTAFWVLADTGAGQPAKVAIDHARLRRQALPADDYRHWFAAVAVAAEGTAQALRSGDVALLAHHLRAAAATLQPLAIVNESMQLAMQVLSKAGAVAVKPTGAGLGGVIVGLAADATAAAAMTAAAAAAGFGVSQFRVASPASFSVGVYASV